jgi:secondary thiamine-phosphate synthase enzyme
MRQAIDTITIGTDGPGLIEFTDRVTAWTQSTGIVSGLLTLFCRHTSASLIIQENAASAVRRDIAAYFDRIAPEGDIYEHDDEGPDDMPAHLKTALTGVSLSIPVENGRPMLGTWQGIYLFEHRHHPHRRQVALHLLGISRERFSQHSANSLKICHNVVTDQNRSSLVPTMCVMTSATTPIPGHVETYR